MSVGWFGWVSEWTKERGTERGGGGSHRHARTKTKTDMQTQRGGEMWGDALLQVLLAPEAPVKGCGSESHMTTSIASMAVTLRARGSTQRSRGVAFLLQRYAARASSSTVKAAATSALQHMCMCMCSGYALQVGFYIVGC